MSRRLHVDRSDAQHGSAIDRIRCEVCGAHLIFITWSHLRKHGLTTFEYREKYGADYLMSDFLRQRVSSFRRENFDTTEDFLPRSKAEIVEDLREFSKGRPTVSSEWLRKKKPSLAKQALYAFGGWSKAAQAAGLMQREQKSWSGGQVLSAIKARQASGASLRDTDVQEHDGTLYSAGQRLFGTWPSAVKKAGLDYDSIRWGKVRSREQVVAALRDYASRRGPLYWSGLESFDVGLGQAARRRFGSVEKAARELGLPYFSMQGNRNRRQRI